MMARRPWVICCSLLVCCGVLSAAAAQRALAQGERAALLEQMTALAKETTVTVADASQPAALVEKPIFRYDDQPRRFIDATMWAWTEGGRPVAFQKIEAIEFGDATKPQSHWQYCFTSLSSELVSVKWPPSRQYQASQPGVEFRAIDGAPPVADASAQRKRQARELMRQFSARILTEPASNNQQEMRPLSRPLFDYAAAGSNDFVGAVFGFSTNGTNPDLLVLMEARGEGDKLAWHFAPARMTSSAVTLKHRDAEVWKCDAAYERERPFPTWTFFALPRAPLDTQEKP
jgi:hypothetical protein